VSIASLRNSRSERASSRGRSCVPRRSEVDFRDDEGVGFPGALEGQMGRPLLDDATMNGAPGILLYLDVGADQAYLDV
jgi:hypothetical protein